MNIWSIVNSHLYLYKPIETNIRIKKYIKSILQDYVNKEHENLRLYFKYDLEEILLSNLLL